MQTGRVRAGTCFLQFRNRLQNLVPESEPGSTRKLPGGSDSGSRKKKEEEVSIAVQVPKIETRFWCERDFLSNFLLGATQGRGGID